MSYIDVTHLTKDYGAGRGIYDVNLAINKGEVFGFVGTNGAGKTTIVRHLMGFLKPQQGVLRIDDMDCWFQANEIKQLVGYLPGEIAFPDAPTGLSFLKQQAELLGLKDFSYANKLIEKLQLDPTANLKRMSKGMKQKTAIVAALMSNPAILILDEPTTGLDPLMRMEFIEILKDEKKKGKTIFMSSHMFEEVEEICDKVAMIKDGKIISLTSQVKYSENKIYQIAFNVKEDFDRFCGEPFECIAQELSNQEVTIKLHDNQINLLFGMLTTYDVKYITETKYTLEKYFTNIYEGATYHV
ncbi:ABC transporter ATP-binding protein [Paenibacillus endoradicis]|uniref:ABC transporter ATP-binding protein n=1 Tax=Paenibacillus endoradicis TaxID=2972487 RepID=UPI002159A0AE|nr:ATP-binding cassette domain-containing protein [Paenibacillus endoradicis]MCR8657701.1 ATP-binding cassette domain-containing protein [Paenibacillus endoradicis]